MGKGRRGPHASTATRWPVTERACCLSGPSPTRTPHTLLGAHPRKSSGTTPVPRDLAASAWPLLPVTLSRQSLAPRLPPTPAPGASSPGRRPGSFHSPCMAQWQPAPAPKSSHAPSAFTGHATPCCGPVTPALGGQPRACPAALCGGATARNSMCYTPSSPCQGLSTCGLRQRPGQAAPGEASRRVCGLSRSAPQTPKRGVWVKRGASQGHCLSDAPEHPAI